MIICLGWPSPTTSSSLPAAFPPFAYARLGVSVRVAPRRLFGLAPAGGYRATTVASGAVGSYPTISPLPLIRTSRNTGRFLFCGPLRRLAAPRRYLAAYPVELGLSSDTSQHPRSSRSTSGYKIMRQGSWVLGAADVSAIFIVPCSSSLPGVSHSSQPAFSLLHKRQKRRIGFPPLGQDLAILLPRFGPPTHPLQGRPPQESHPAEHAPARVE
jgi:hypothetical protein